MKPMLHSNQKVRRRHSAEHYTKQQLFYTSLVSNRLFVSHQLHITVTEVQFHQTLKIKLMAK